ncbi:chorismate--pyruvate lyase family protein [Legionella septentrionalis]|uniref:Chorismate lyase n=1 Tax=Legionella septentrionalis TaxID=2498109 RepID=A0A3S0VBD5_9GAMM|nr:chorismate lyase [Legionella septentrionalis]RUQ89716.1 chorismate lyase [Legionella septentrionalis]RUR15229.1 chorismate lyase [Legionella septentrionalis]
MLITPFGFPSPAVEPPAKLLPWLTHRQSLTEKLKAITSGVRLQVLMQQWGWRGWWDNYILHLNSGRVLHREIVMKVGEEACWYGRTILPEKTYQHNAALFKRLQNESLGQLIFGANNIERISLVYYPITPKVIEYHWLDAALHHGAPALWGRLAEFIVCDHFPFYLLEILLPGLNQYLE